MQLHERSVAKAEALLISLGERDSQNSVKEEAGFEIRSGRGVFDCADAVAQVELFRALLNRAKQALEASAEIGCFADVGLGLRVLAPQEEHGRAGWHGSKQLGIVFGHEFKTLGQHSSILEELDEDGRSEPDSVTNNQPGLYREGRQERAAEFAKKSYREILAKFTGSSRCGISDENRAQIVSRLGTFREGASTCDQ